MRRPRTHRPPLPSVGAGPFVRLLSGGIGQHHLHLHAVDHTAVQRHHGLVSALPARDDEEQPGATVLLWGRVGWGGGLPVCLRTLCIPLSAREPDRPQ